MCLERRGDKVGLNLTEEVLDGIAKHSKHGGALAGYADVPLTLEGQIVRYCDRLAYINHDIDDAIRAGIIAQEDLPRQAIETLGPQRPLRIETVVARRHRCMPRRRTRSSSREPVLDAVETIKEFMFERVYLNDAAKTEEPKAQNVVEEAFHLLHGASAASCRPSSLQAPLAATRWRAASAITSPASRTASRSRNLRSSSSIRCESQIPREWDA